jgi:hypothetical protein
MFIPTDIGLDIPDTLNRMLDELRGFLEPVNGLPIPEVILVSLNNAPVGLGKFLGEKSHNMLGGTELKGGRFDCVVRFVLWEANILAINDAMLRLQTSLLTATRRLLNRGFLRFNALTSSNPAFDSKLGVWIRTADYSLLYEYRYEATDVAESLIARIPIQSDLEERNSDQRETTIVTNKMVRWDDDAAPVLVVRGPVSIRDLIVIAFIPSNAPDGKVTFTRTFNGATGLPTIYSTLQDFMTAVTDPNAPDRHAQLVFDSLSIFLDAFSEDHAFIKGEEHLGSEAIPITLKMKPIFKSVWNQIDRFVDVTGSTQSLQILYGGGLSDDDPGSPGTGQVKVDRMTGALTFGDIVTANDKVIASYATQNTVSLGDWNEDGVLDSYQPRTLAFEPVIELQDMTDRLELAHENNAFNQVAVVYLRAMRG